MNRPLSSLLAGEWGLDRLPAYLSAPGLVVVVEGFEADESATAHHVVITTRPPVAGATLTLVNERGCRFAASSPRPGQYCVDGVEGEAWLVEVDEPSNVVSLAGRFAALTRVLDAAAAGGEHRQVRGRYSSADGALRTEVEENEDGHLIVTVATVDGVDEVVAARARWALVQTNDVGPVRTLAVPLAPRRAGGAATASYDLGSLTGVEAVHVEAAEPIPLGELGPAEVQAAFDLGPYGDAIRSWRSWAEDPRCSPELRRAILEAAP
ncbi:MAG: hypothetical protein ACKVWR_09950 [Acidimicrobiales bacterium]